MKTKFITSLLLSTMLSSCSTFCDEAPVPSTSVVSKRVVRENNIRGTVTQSWAEPMHDTVKVPGQIDPTNTYYRSPHQTVVEIRPGKYSETRYDNEGK